MVAERGGEYFIIDAFNLPPTAPRHFRRKPELVPEELRFVKAVHDALEETGMRGEREPHPAITSPEIQRISPALERYLGDSGEGLAKVNEYFGQESALLTGEKALSNPRNLKLALLREMAELHLTRRSHSGRVANAAQKRYGGIRKAIKAYRNESVSLEEFPFWVQRIATLVKAGKLADSGKLTATLHGKTKPFIELKGKMREEKTRITVKSRFRRIMGKLPRAIKVRYGYQVKTGNFFCLISFASRSTTEKTGEKKRVGITRDVLEASVPLQEIASRKKGTRQLIKRVAFLPKPRQPWTADTKAAKNGVATNDPITRETLEFSVGLQGVEEPTTVAIDNAAFTKRLPGLAETLGKNFGVLLAFDEKTGAPKVAYNVKERVPYAYLFAYKPATQETVKKALAFTHAWFLKTLLTRGKEHPEVRQLIRIEDQLARELREGGLPIKAEK
jgi:hypothetical protein